MLHSQPGVPAEPALSIPSLAKQWPATVSRGQRSPPIFLFCSLASKGRAVLAVKAKLVVAVVHGTEGMPCSHLVLH